MKKIIILIFLLIISASVCAEIIVIGNVDNDVTTLTKKQVQELFMGRRRTFLNGMRALPLDMVALRAKFYKKLTQRPIEQINAYWARLMFSGQSSPPILKSGQQAVIDAVKKTKGAIAYIESEKITDTHIKLLFSFKIRE